MPSAHGLIFYRRQKNGMKIASCALTFVPIKNRSDAIQQWGLACYCNNTILGIKNQAVCAKGHSEKNR